MFGELRLNYGGLALPRTACAIWQNNVHPCAGLTSGTPSWSKSSEKASLVREWPVSIKLSIHHSASMCQTSFRVGGQTLVCVGARTFQLSATRRKVSWALCVQCYWDWQLQRLLAVASRGHLQSPLLRLQYAAAVPRRHHHTQYSQSESSAHLWGTGFFKWLIPRGFFKIPRQGFIS